MVFSEYERTYVNCNAPLSIIRTNDEDGAVQLVCDYIILHIIAIIIIAQVKISQKND